MQDNASFFRSVKELYGMIPSQTWYDVLTDVFVESEQKYSFIEIYIGEKYSDYECFHNRVLNLTTNFIKYKQPNLLMKLATFYPRIVSLIFVDPSLCTYDGRLTFSLNIDLKKCLMFAGSKYLRIENKPFFQNQDYKYARCLSEIPDYSDRYLYVLRWFTDQSDGVISAVGCDKTTRKLYKITTKHKCYYYIFLRKDTLSQSLDIINRLAWKLDGVDATRKIERITLFSHETFYSNGTHVLQYLRDIVSAKRNIFENERGFDDIRTRWVPYRLPMKNYYHTKILHKLLSNENVCYSYINYFTVFGDWNMNMMIFLQKITNKNQNPAIYMNYVDRDLCSPPESNEKLDLKYLAFDIEVISHLNVRLPLGEMSSDIVFSISIVCNADTFPDDLLFNKQTESLTFSKYCNDKNSTSKINSDLYRNPSDNTTRLTLVHLPVKSLGLYYEQYPNCLLFSEEINLIRTFLDLMLAINESFYCLGYNSKGFDMLVIFKRVIYYNLTEYVDFFKDDEGVLVIGTNMIHLDLYLLISNNYCLQSFKLGFVSKQLIGEDKIDFNAILLRHVYRQLLNHNETGKPLLTFQIDEQQTVSFNDIVKYNEVDALLVKRLFDKLQLGNLIKILCSNYMISPTRLPQSLKKEYISNKIIKDAISKFNTVMTIHSNVSVIYDPETFSHVTVNTNDAVSKFTLNRQLESPDSTIMSLKRKREVIMDNDADENSKFSGGFNYRLRRGYYERCIVGDFSAYYPSLIQQFNISHEFSTVVFQKDFYRLFGNHKDVIASLIKYNYLVVLQFTNHTFDEQLTCNMCLSTNNISDLQNMYKHMYMIGSLKNMECLTADEICRDDDSGKRLIILFLQQTGLLPKLIKHQNHLRDLSKKNISLVNNQITLVKNIISRHSCSNIAKNKKDFIDPEYTNLDGDKAMVICKLNLYDERYLSSFDRASLDCYLKALHNEAAVLLSLGTNLKTVNNSFFGMTGMSNKMTSVLKCNEVACIITAQGRKHIIETSKLAQTLGLQTVFTDTDSVFLCPEKAMSETQLVEKATLLFEQVKLKWGLNMSKTVYSDVFVIAKKTYLYRQGSTLSSKGINVRGPKILANIQNYFYQKYVCDRVPLFVKDLKKIIQEEYYDKVIAAIRQDRKHLLIEHNVRKMDEYKTQTPILKLMKKILAKHPKYEFDKKMSYFIIKSNDGTPELEIDHNLYKVPFEQLNISDFITSDKSFNVIFHIVTYAIYRTNLEKRGIYYILQDSEFIDTVNDVMVY